MLTSLLIPSLRNDQLRSSSPSARQLSVGKLTVLVSACRHLMTGEPAKRFRLLDCHCPVMDFNPSSLLETTQGRVDGRPGASGLMRELLLAHAGPDGAVAVPGLAEQHLSDATGEVQEDQV